MRKWKHPREFGEAQWEYEIGEAPKTFNPEADLLAPSGDNVKVIVNNLILAHIHQKGYC